MKWRIEVGDCREVMRTMPDASVDCCVTSPPYWGLRDYGHEGQIGLEETPEAYIARMVEVFREVRRVLKDDGTLWLNLGDSYNSIGHKKSGSGYGSTGLAGGVAQEHTPLRRENTDPSLKHKDLVGIPWRVAFALQADGWWLRQDIIWHKPNPMPESVRDRCTKAHEYVFMLTKSSSYFFDAEANAEPAIHAGITVKASREAKNQQMGKFSATRGGFAKDGGVLVGATRNRRSVWSICSRPFAGSHFAVMPFELAHRCVVLSSRAEGTVIDPFSGAGTTGLAATMNGRNYIGLELNPEYAELSRRRIEHGDITGRNNATQDEPVDDDQLDLFGGAS